MALLSWILPQSSALRPLHGSPPWTRPASCSCPSENQERPGRLWDLESKDLSQERIARDWDLVWRERPEGSEPLQLVSVSRRSPPSVPHWPPRLPGGDPTHRSHPNRPRSSADTASKYSSTISPWRNCSTVSQPLTFSTVSLSHFVWIWPMLIRASKVLSALASSGQTDDTWVAPAGSGRNPDRWSSTVGAPPLSFVGFCRVFSAARRLVKEKGLCQI